MAAFNYEALRACITDFCSSCEGADWTEVGTKVSRLGHWEFEDYRSHYLACARDSIQLTFA